MDTSIIIPAGFALEGFSKHAVMYEVADGVGMYRRGFNSIVRVDPAPHEREFLFKTQEVFKDFRLIDKRGLEVVDPNPVEVPLNLKATPTMKEQIVEQISRYLSARAADEGYETLEEAMDFDIPGELDDLQTAAEGSFLASFAPHEGRANNTPRRPGERPTVAPKPPEVPSGENPDTGEEVPIER